MSDLSSFMGERQVLLVGLGGVGGRIVDNLMKNLPENRKNITQAIAVDTDIKDMSKLSCIPKENRIVLASNPGSNTSMTIGAYLQKTPEAKEWFISGGKAFGALMKRSTKDGAKQIRMVSRVALSATAKYCNLEGRITNIIDKLCASDGNTNRDGLLVMVVCSIAGGTGAGTVLQFPMYLEEILAKHYNPSEISMQCAMLLPNLFKQTLAAGNGYKAKVNGYSVIRELQSLNTGKLKRFEYMKDYAEIDESDYRNSAPYSYVLLFDDSTSTGATINGSADRVHVPNVARCLYEYIFGVASGRCKSALDNTLDAIYNSENRKIFRAVGSATLIYPDNLYKQYAVANWILRSVSEDWLHPGAEARKTYLEIKQKARDEGKPIPPNEFRHKLYTNAVFSENICTGPFFSEIRRQLSQNVDDDKNLAETYADRVFDSIIENLNNDEDYSRSYENVFTTLKAKAADNDFNSFKNLDNSFNNYFSTVSSIVDNLICPRNALTKKFLKNDTNMLCLYTFIRQRQLHPVALLAFLYELEEYLLSFINEEETKAISQEDIVKNAKYAKRNAIAETVKGDLNKYAAAYENKIRQAVAARIYEKYIKEFIIETEDFFNDLVRVMENFKSISNECINDINTLSNEITEVIGSKEGMIACWNDVKNTLSEGDTCDDDVVDPELSEEINREIYTAFYNLVTDENYSDDEEIFRRKTNYKDIVSSHLLKNFYKRINTQHTKAFPEDIIKAAIFETGVKKAYDEQSSLNPKFKEEKFSYPVTQSEIDYSSDADFKKDAADYLNGKLKSLVVKANPISGPLNNADYEGRTLFFDESILEKKTKASLDSEGDMEVETVTSQFIPGVETSTVDTFTIQIEPVKGMNKHRIGCFSYTGGLEPANFENLQDPVSGTYDSKSGRCYYNAYRDYINNVMNTTEENITPHLHREWHVAGRLNDITDDHTDSVNIHAARAFLYGFLFDDVIKIDEYGYVKIGLAGNKFFNDLPGAINGILTYKPFSEVEHAQFVSSRNMTNRVLYEVFQYLRNVPEVRTLIIKYGEEQIESAKANSSGKVFVYSIKPEICATEEYKTIIDVIDGFYQYARFSDLHNSMNSDVKVLGDMFNILSDVIIDVCASIYPSSKAVLEAFNNYVDRLYDTAVCDDPVNTKAVDMFTEGTIEATPVASSRPFSDSGDLYRDAMKKKMETYLNSLQN